MQRSITKTNRFFAYTYSNGRYKCNLKLHEILMLVYFFLYSNDTLDEFVTKLGHSKFIVCDWPNMCRKVCTKVIRSLPKMVGTTAQAVQIYESYFQGRRKYHRERVLEGDKKKEDEKRKMEEMKKKEAMYYDLGKVVGPWVFGLYMPPTRHSFHVVHNRSSDTLSPLVHENGVLGSTIVSDK